MNIQMVTYNMDRCMKTLDMDKVSIISEMGLILWEFVVKTISPKGFIKTSTMKSSSANSMKTEKKV